MDLNSKELLGLSSISVSAGDHVGAHLSALSCSLPPTPFSVLCCRCCCDKSATSSAPSCQKYTHFWPRARLPNSLGGCGEGAGRPARWDPTTSGQRWSSCLSPLDPQHARGQMPPQRAGAVPPSSDGGLSEDETVSFVTVGTPLGRNPFPSSLFLPQKSREIVIQRDCV